jgi:hypothetical protein
MGDQEMTNSVRFAVLMVAPLAAILWIPHATAQMQLGSVEFTSPLQGGCPANRGFDPGMTCYTATLTACPNVPDLAFVYGVENPTGARGTIVMLPGGGGSSAAEDPGMETTYVSQYAADGYQVVQIAWGGPQGTGQDWQTWPLSLGAPSYNIRNAACRPATFLHWVRFGSPGWPGLWARGGMCAQGASAGSGAVSYALAWYGAGASTQNGGYLDKAEMLSGPTLSDLKKGCQVPNNNSTAICKSNQLGCLGWNSNNPNYNLEYIGHYKNDVQAWSGATGPACANNMNTTTFDTQWLQMSIVDFTSQQQPSFTYPQTAMSAWLCQSVAQGVVPNNAAPEGELFYLNFSSLSQFGGNAYGVNAVNVCPTQEGVSSGTAWNGQTGQVAIFNDMTDSVNGCVARH